MINLHLYKNVTPEQLVKAGFKQQSEEKNIYRFRENLYNNLIFLSIRIALRADPEEQLEWHVIDGSTGLSYNTFYFTPNVCKDLVRENVHKAFYEAINELDQRGILYLEENIQ